MSVQRLDNARDFFDLVVQVSFDKFMGEPSTFANAFAMANALFHFHEWLFELENNGLMHETGQTFVTAGKYWLHVEGEVPEAKYIRDLTNASKHVKIGIKHPASTGMSHIANTIIQTIPYGTGTYGAGRYGGQNMKFEDQGVEVSLDDCATKLFNYWKTLINKLRPPAPLTLTINPTSQ